VPYTGAISNLNLGNRDLVFGVAGNILLGEDSAVSFDGGLSLDYGRINFSGGRITGLSSFHENDFGVQPGWAAPISFVTNKTMYLQTSKIDRVPGVLEGLNWVPAGNPVGDFSSQYPELLMFSADQGVWLQGVQVAEPPRRDPLFLLGRTTVDTAAGGEAFVYLNEAPYTGIRQGNAVVNRFLMVPAVNAAGKKARMQLQSVSTLAPALPGSVRFWRIPGSTGVPAFSQSRVRIASWGDGVRLPHAVVSSSAPGGFETLVVEVDLAGLPPHDEEAGTWSVLGLDAEAPFPANSLQLVLLYVY
jgi:hypothetical protein